MNVKFAYAGRSEFQGSVLRLSPNLARDPVAFDAPLLKPLRFREAISALHDVVISDLRFKPRDKTAYEEWKKSERQRESAFRKEAYKTAAAEILARRGEAVEPDFEKNFNRLRGRYWRIRQEYADYLRKNDPALWRMLMPCDPVITVAPDILFFECFSSDESSYGCLSVDRGAFGKCANEKCGTTNVDYSWDLYNHFQALRSYRETRFNIDPSGFEVATTSSANYREEKIDLPTSWLRGFMQLQSAMGMPMRKVSLTREAVYSLCAFLKRHKARQSPRALRFEFLPGKPLRLVLEPWEQEIIVHGSNYDGPPGEPVRVWGKQRLLVLSRLLPLIDGVDVYLLGTGLPHFWVARMGEMRLTLGLSGWTTNDWTRSAALDLLLPQSDIPRAAVYDASKIVRQSKSVTFAEVNAALNLKPAVTAATLNQLAHSGQLIYDLTQGVYRWRQIMPMPLGEDQIGPEHPELASSRQIVDAGRVKIKSSTPAPKGGTLHTGRSEGVEVEMLIDADGRISRGKCSCTFFHTSGLRKGACRHLLALRGYVMRRSEGALAAQRERWYDWGYLLKGE